MTDLEPVVSAKKKALLAYKEKLLNGINLCEKRLDQVRLYQSQANVFEDEDERENETGLPESLHAGPTATQLELTRSNLSVCLQATQELTSLNVLQSEVNVAVDPPELGHKVVPPIGGTWKEVAAECRVDLVPFSMTFFVHQPDEKFSAPSYHNLQVKAVKAAHDLELAKSVLGDVRTPSDAVQVIRSYAVAHRSRRTTLARLADRFAGTLFMEAMATGGYLLKCADALTVSWTLQNKWSHIAAFHHKMQFELEYMDEQYLREIKRAHNQLIDPTLETDERTRLLALIIETCLEATRVPTESETDTEGRGRRTTLEAEPEIGREEPRDRGLPEVGAKRRKKDSEVMAPPKQLPKKGKPKGKGKESTAGDSAIKQKDKEIVRNEEIDKPNYVSKQKSRDSDKNLHKDNVKSKDNAKRVQDNDPNREGVKEKDQVMKEKNVNEKVVSGQKGNEKAIAVQNNKENAQKPKEVSGNKDKQSLASTERSKEAAKSMPDEKENNVDAQKVLKEAVNLAVNAKKVLKAPLNKGNEKNVLGKKAKTKESTVKESQEVKMKMKTDNIKKAAKRPLEKVNEKQTNEANVKAKQNSQSVKKVKAKESTADVNKEVNIETEPENTKKLMKRPLESNTKAKETTHNKNSDVASKKAKITEARTEGNTKKTTKSDNVADLNPKDDNNKKQNEKANKQVEDNVVKSNPDTKNKPAPKKSEPTKEAAQVEKVLSGNIVLNEIGPRVGSIATTKATQNPNENDKNAQNKPPKIQTATDRTKHPYKTISSNASEKLTKIPMKTAQNKPIAKLSVPSKRPTVQSVTAAPRMFTHNFKKGSKIPQKNLVAISEAHARRFENPLRISPRRTPSAVKAAPTVGIKRVEAAIRNSPRLLKKPAVKPKSLFAF